MVYKKKTYKKKVYKKRAYRKAKITYNPKIARCHKIVSMTQMNNVTYTPSGAGPNTIGAPNGWLLIETAATTSIQYFTAQLTFTLNDLGDYASILGLYQSYKIDKVAVRIRRLFTDAVTNPPGLAGPANPSLAGTIHMANNYLGTSPPASEVGLNLMRDYQDCKEYNMVGTPQIVHWCKPRILQSVLDDALLATGYAFGAKGGWLPTNTGQDAIWNGMNVLFKILNPSNNAYYLNFEIESEYFLSLKDMY